MQPAVFWEYLPAHRGVVVVAHCYTAAHGSMLQHIAACCNTLLHAATHCSMLQHTAACCNTLQHAATHCSMLQHTAACCNTLEHTVNVYLLIKTGGCGTSLKHTATY